MAKVWSREEIRERLLQGEAAWLERAIVALFQLQTPDEQRDGVTRYRNGEGFNRDDAWYGTYLARHLQNGGKLTDFPMALVWAQARMPRYAGQLASLVNRRRSVG
jgi:hypothetical protein